MGSSILGGCVGAITESSQNSGFDVIVLCKGGDFKKNISLLVYPNPKINKYDTIVLLFLGNNIFLSKRGMAYDILAISK